MTDAPDYGEPWHFDFDGLEEPAVYSSKEMVAECYVESEAQRIISCVNACRGIPDPEKVVPLLLEAVKAVEAYDVMSGGHHWWSAMDDAIAALKHGRERRP